MYVFIIALISIMLSVAAQFTLKAGMSSEVVKAMMQQPLSLTTALELATNRLVFAGFAMYGIGAVVWLGVLSRWDVSKAYPLVGVGFGLTAVIGAIMGEQITLPRLMGILLICIGVYFVSRS